jgi:hypothetical protein
VGLNERKRPEEEVHDRTEYGSDRAKYEVSGAEPKHTWVDPEIEHSAAHDLEAEPHGERSQHREDRHDRREPVDNP